MKFLPAQMAYLLDQREMRQNLRALARFGIFLAGSIVGFSVLFHVIMTREGQDHSWITGLYWTLTVMSTLGFGDITFRGDLGRLFSVVVLVYGIVMLLIVAPFTFIRFFYAPWLEAQVRLRAPRAVDPRMSGHVVIARYDEIAQELIERLSELGIPYVVIEGDAPEAAQIHGDGVVVVAGEFDSSRTYKAVRADHARLVIANLGDDAQNTSATLTVREVAPDVPVVALAHHHDSEDVLSLAGATHVVPLRQRLGEQLASRVTAGMQTAHRIGQFEDLVIAEFPVHGTSLAGRTVRDTRLRQLTGLNVVAVWERGRLEPAGPETTLSEHSVPVVIGTEEQLTELDAFFVIYQETEAPVLVIGGGTVGQEVGRALRERGAFVTILDRDPAVQGELGSAADRVVIGDAANLETVKEAGIDEAPSVVLTTADDATNAFLAIYCRKLNNDAHIVSRITSERNLEAIHRAGADFALSQSSLAVQTLLALIRDRELIIVGEGVELFVEPVPARLIGNTIAQSAIGAETGMNVIGLRQGGSFRASPPATTELTAGTELVLIGTVEQRQAFLAQQPHV